MTVKYPVQNGIVCDPTQDGVTHINVYSKGATWLGRRLSNMDRAGVSIKGVGFFCSLEGYWWWLSTGRTYDNFKNLSGFEARKEGMKLPKVELDNFQELFRVGLSAKIEQHADIRRALILNNLPLLHYYYYGTPPNCKVTAANRSIWQLEMIQTLRNSLIE